MLRLRTLVEARLRPTVRLVEARLQPTANRHPFLTDQPFVFAYDPAFQIAEITAGKAILADAAGPGVALHHEPIVRIVRELVGNRGEARVAPTSPQEWVAEPNR